MTTDTDTDTTTISTSTSTSITSTDSGPCPETARSVDFPAPLSQQTEPEPEEPEPAIGHSNGYPFMTKAQIKAKLAEDQAFRHQCMRIMVLRQTDDEQASKSTKYKNKSGFMSSHAVHGTRIGLLLLDNKELSPEDEDRCTSMIVRYSKQLAAHFRNQSLTTNPELRAKAAIFGL